MIIIIHFKCFYSSYSLVGRKLFKSLNWNQGREREREREGRLRILYNITWHFGESAGFGINELSVGCTRRKNAEYVQKRNFSYTEKSSFEERLTNVQKL